MKCREKKDETRLSCFKCGSVLILATSGFVSWNLKGLFGMIIGKKIVIFNAYCSHMVSFFRLDIPKLLLWFVEFNYICKFSIVRSKFPI